jgi:hypothetical protein
MCRYWAEYDNAETGELFEYCKASKHKTNCCGEPDHCNFPVKREEMEDKYEGIATDTK